MVLNYSITDAEFKEYINHYYKTTYFQKNGKTFLLLFAFLVLFHTYSSYMHYKDMEGEFVGDFVLPLLTYLGLVIGLVLVFMLIMSRLKVNSFLKGKDRDLILGERTVIMTDETLQTKTPTAETTYQWSGLIKWAETPNLYLIYISLNGAIMLPKRLIKTEEDKTALLTLFQKIGQ